MSLRRRRKCDVPRLAKTLETISLVPMDVLGQDSIRGVVDALWRSTVGFGSHPSHKSQLPTPTRPVGAGSIAAFHLSSSRTRARQWSISLRRVATRNRPLLSGLGHGEHPVETRLPKHAPAVSPPSNVLALQRFQLVLVSHHFPLWPVSVKS